MNIEAEVKPRDEQAFPLPYAQVPYGDGFIGPEYGMTIGDYFAAKALPCLIGPSSVNLNDDQLEQVAQAAYKISRYMLRERSK